MVLITFLSFPSQGLNHLSETTMEGGKPKSKQTNRNDGENERISLSGWFFFNSFTDVTNLRAILYCCLVTKSCLTLCNPVDCSPPDSSVLGISQARILEWVAIPFSKSYIRGTVIHQSLKMWSRLKSSLPLDHAPLCPILWISHWTDHLDCQTQGYKRFRESATEDRISVMTWMMTKRRDFDRLLWLLLKESQLLTHFCPCVVYGKVKGFEIHLARILWMPWPAPRYYSRW